MKRFAAAVLIMVLVMGAIPKVQAAEVKAKSAVLMDVETGTVLFEQNAHEPLPPASVTKVMTMLLIMEAIDSGRIGWDDIVTASEAAAAKGGSQIYLEPGEQMTVSDMLKSIAVSSANDCACAMAEHLAGSESAFAEKMNQRAKALGMNDTHFVNCTGLDDGEDAQNHKTSAYDIALMSRELLKNHPDIVKFTTIWMDTVRDGAFGLSNTNKLVRFYPGTTGLKTGYTSQAGYCLSASAEKDGLGLIAVVMGSDTSTDRFESCKALLNMGFAEYALYRPEYGGDVVQVKLGSAAEVQAAPAAEDALLLEKEMLPDVSWEVTLEESVTAPVSKGQKLGELTVHSGSRILAKIPLVAQSAVARKTWWETFRQVLRTIAMGA